VDLYVEAMSEAASCLLGDVPELRVKIECEDWNMADLRASTSLTRSRFAL
jgi:hypothetical protein